MLKHLFSLRFNDNKNEKFNIAIFEDIFCSFYHQSAVGVLMLCNLAKFGYEKLLKALKIVIT